MFPLSEIRGHSLLALFFILAFCLPTEFLWAEQLSESRILVACGRLLMFIEGAFGALLATTAGIAAIISSAIGNYRMFWALLVVSLGSFILRSFLTLFFGPCTAVG